MSAEHRIPAGVREQVELDGIRATAIRIEAGTQPWQPRRECYRAEVTVSSSPDNAHDRFQLVFHGSSADFEAGKPVDLMDAAWTVLDELLSASYDPDEFWSMATEGETFERERIEKVLETLEYAKRHAETLDRNARAIEEWRENA